MKVMFLDAPYSRSVELSQDTLDYLKEKGYLKVGLYSSVQFVGKLEEVKKQLKEAGIVFHTYKADRTNVEGQLLGCDSFPDSLNLKREVDCFLYIGDGKFHPLALVYGQKEEKKEIICNDPLQKKMFLVSQEDVSSILKRYKGSLVRFLSSRNIGVIVTIKPGQEQLKPAFLLEKKYQDKKFYYFIDNNVSFDQLENYPFIEAWVNTSCPRVGLDDQEKFLKGVINLNDALRVEEFLADSNSPSIKRKV